MWLPALGVEMGVEKLKKFGLRTWFKPAQHSKAQSQKSNCKFTDLTNSEINLLAAHLADTQG